MDGRKRALRDVKSTVAAHQDRGDGRCAGFHGEDTPPGDAPVPPAWPCAVHDHFVRVAEQLRRES